MLSIALALNHIHGRRICHFDIKSPNVLLAKDGQAKLADVGLSKLVKDDATAMSRPGTYSYAAPEQLQVLTACLLPASRPCTSQSLQSLPQL